MHVQSSGLYALLLIVATAIAEHSSSSIAKNSSVPTGFATSITCTSNLQTISPIASSVKSKPGTKSKAKSKSSTLPSTSSPSPAPSPPPATFYLIVNTIEPGFDNTYLHLIPEEFPAISTSGALVLQAGLPTSTGAATFTLTSAGYLICNTATGPLYASRYPYESGINSQPVEFLPFDDPTTTNAYGSVAVNCTLVEGVLSCISTVLTTINFFFLSEGYVVNDAPDLGHILYLARSDYTTPMITVRAVPT